MKMTAIPNTLGIVRGNGFGGLILGLDRLVEGRIPDVALLVVHVVLVGFSDVGVPLLGPALVDSDVTRLLLNLVLLLIYDRLVI